MKIIWPLGIGLYLLWLMAGATGCASAKPKMGESTPKAEQAEKEKPPEATPSPQEQKPTPLEKAQGEKLPFPSAPPVQRPSPPQPPSFPAAQPPSGMPAEPPRGAKFVLNFDNADLFEVIRVMSEMMKINYVVDPRVKGVVNIHTSGQISSEEVFPVFQSILKLNGATAVKKGIVYEIVPFGDAKKLYASPSASREEMKKVPEERYIIQVIPLKWMPVNEMSKTIKPFLSDGADIVEHIPQNILIIGDIGYNIQKTLEIIDLFDTDIFADKKVRIYPIVNADVNEVSKEMERIFGSLEVSMKSGRGIGITFTPIIRINSLLVVSSIPQIFEKVEGWLKELDRMPGMGSRLSVFVYYVQNGKAKDMADVLKQVYGPIRPTTQAGMTTTTPTTPTTQRPSVRPTTAPTPTGSTTPYVTEGPLASGTMPQGEVNIVVDETTNSLIIRSFERDYKLVLETIKKLDLYPKQALIEVLLAEVTLEDSYKYGLEFSTFQDSFVRGGRTYSYTVGAGGIKIDPNTFTSGVRYALSSTDKLFAAINASANANRLRVLSSPHILASNNKEAKIQIGASQPILTNTYTTTATGTPGVVEGSIEYKDTGIILTVTPRISDGGLVTLDISVESSSVATTSLGNLSSIPVFNKKTAKTTLSVVEGQSIVLGGLIEESKDTTSSGIPFLSRIPILGALFGYQTYDKTKTETLLLMTPHVISDLQQSNTITQEFRDKVGAIKKEVEMREKELKKE